MNFLSNDALVGKILREILKLIPKETQVFILTGKLKGKKWIKGSGVNGYWLGIYEANKQKLFGKLVKNGDVVFDVGAHVGFYTLLASELVGEKGRVFSFEPLPRNISYLKRHLMINNVKNVMVTETAVSERSGTALFKGEESTFSGSINLNEGVEVRVISLDEFMKAEKIPLPEIIKIDVEGSELSVLKGATSLLKDKHPIIFLATHSHAIRVDCLLFLEGLGYKMKPVDGDNVNETDEILAYFNNENRLK